MSPRPDDGLDIPAWLRVENRPPLTPEQEERLRSARPMGNFVPTPVRTEERAAFEAEVSAQRRARRIAQDAQREARRSGATRAMPLTGRAAMAAIAGVGGTRTGRVTHATPVVEEVEKALRRSGDDLAARLAGLDPAALRALAERNGVWKPEYAALPNPGLVRMSVGNRLRARIKRGEVVSW